MSTAIHIINKQVFEFECRQSEHAFQIQKKVDHVLQEKISRAINTVCTELAGEDEDIQVPLLEIDLGVISFENMEEEIATFFERKFYEKLSEKVYSHGSRSLVSLNRKLPSIESLRHFLLTGNLPWFSGKKDQYYVADLFEEVFSMEGDELRRLFLLNFSNEKFLERFISYADTSTIESIINQLGLSENIIQEIEIEIKLVVEKILSVIEKIQKEKPGTYEYAFIGEEEIKRLENAKKQIDILLNNEQSIPAQTWRKIAFDFTLKLLSGKDQFSRPAEFFEVLFRMVADKFNFNPEIVALNVTEEKIRLLNLPETIYKEQKRLEKEAALLVQETGEEGRIAEQLKFYISNAGLILLAQYLPALFNQLGLLEHGAFANKQDKIKSVFLLHYLCTGEEKVPEYILPLNKLLCGLSMDEPLPSFVALSKEEKLECIELLQEVINNWQRLGQSSEESLREAFLNREGILSLDSNGWKLQVERKGYDILLDSLPWSYKQIKLSWMENIITTEW